MLLSDLNLAIALTDAGISVDSAAIIKSLVRLYQGEKCLRDSISMFERAMAALAVQTLATNTRVRLQELKGNIQLLLSNQMARTENKVDRLG